MTVISNCQSTPKFPWGQIYRGLFKRIMNTHCSVLHPASLYNSVIDSQWMKDPTEITETRSISEDTIEAGCLFICPKIFLNLYSFYIPLIKNDSRNVNTENEGQGESFLSNNEMMEFLKGFREEIGQFSKSLSDLTTWKNHNLFLTLPHGKTTSRKKWALLSRRIK